MPPNHRPLGRAGVRAPSGAALAAALLALVGAGAGSGARADDPASEAKPPAAPPLTAPPPADEREVLLDPITVTARRWEEDRQDVPQSLTVLTAREIEDAGITTQLEASRRVPNLHVVEFDGRRLSLPFIRGVGSGIGDPAVVTYLDGVPQLTNSSGNPAFLDLDRIEVLRGAQGALWGRNALGGVIHYVSRRPPREALEARASTTIGNYGLYDVGGRVGAPLVGDALGASAAVRYAVREGYTKNDVTGNDIDTRRSVAGRAQVAFAPADGFEARLIVSGERARDGGFALSDLDALRERPRRLRYDFEGDIDRDLLSGTLALRADLGAVVVESATGLQWMDARERSDFDFSELDLVRRETPEDLFQLTEELRVGTPGGAPHDLGSALTLRWLAGVLFFHGRSERGFANELRPDAVTFGLTPVAGVDRSESDGIDWGVAAYGQATLGLWERLDLTLGLRFDFEEKKARIENAFDVAGAPPSPASVTRIERDFAELSPSVEVAYRVTDDLLAYARAARGFKAGGFNARAPDGSVAFDPERSWTFEVGAKTSWLDDRVSLDLSLFWVDWRDMQLTLFDPVIGGFVENAGEARSLGLEVEVAARPWRWLDVYSGFGWTRARFVDFDQDPATGDADDHDLPLAPRFTWHGGVEARWEVASGIALFARVEEVVIGRYDYDAANSEAQGSYALTNARLGVRGEHWWVEAWVRNAFEEDFFPLAFGVGPGSFIATSGAPRTFGLTAGVRF